MINSAWLTKLNSMFRKRHTGATLPADSTSAVQSESVQSAPAQMNTDDARRTALANTTAGPAHATTSSIMQRYPLLAEGIDKVIAWFRALSIRERSIVVAGAVLILAIGADQLYSPIEEIFAEQAEKLAAFQRNATATPAVVERYARLRSRREQLEKRFKEIEFKEGALSYIENLVRQQPGVAPGFDIREGSAKSFGKFYQQQPYLVRFQTTNATGLVEFLKSVARGERSLLISKLEIQKPRRGDRLEVDLELNTIRKAGQ